MGLPRFCSASGMFAEARLDGFHAIMRKLCASIQRRLRASPNSILSCIADGWDGAVQGRWMRLHAPAATLIPKCTDCLDVEVNDEDLVAYQSDRDVPSDLSGDESDNGSDNGDDGHSDDGKQSDEEAETIYRDIFVADSVSEEDGKASNPDRPKVRRRRYANHRGPGRQPHTAYVRMPTGRKYRISSPRPRKWDCKSRTIKITMKRYGWSRSEYQIIHKEMDKTIRSHPGQSFKRYKIIKLQKLINGCLWKRYLHRQKEILAEVRFVNQRMLFHGSTKIDDIMNSGFNEQYASTNGMFGAGLYFAKHSSKANQYNFGAAVATPCPTHKDANCFLCERKLLLCRVILGKTKNVFTAHKYPHPPVGYNSVTGVPSKGHLKYPEYIVYRREQVYPEYLITYKISN